MTIKEKKFKYFIVRENGFVFWKVFTLDEIQEGYAKAWLAVNIVGGKDKIYRLQFIGFRDSCGIEIYELDIIEHKVADKILQKIATLDGPYGIDINEKTEIINGKVVGSIILKGK
jgi:hypothetical protein